LEFLEDKKYRSINSFCKSDEEKECPKTNAIMKDEVYPSRKCDRLSECREKSSNSVKNEPKFSNQILRLSCEVEFPMYDFGLVFFSCKNTNNFEVCKCVDYTIK
jgi:hypothetical protein